MDSLRSLFINKFVHQANVCKCSSGHDSIIPSAGAIRIELSRSQAIKGKENKEKKGIVVFRLKHSVL